MSKKTKALIYLVVLVILLLVGILIVKNKINQNGVDLKKIKVNEVTRSVFYAPQYVAINNGYFKTNGMDIELTTGQGAETPLPC